MIPRITLYGCMASAITAAVSGLLYISAKSRLASYLEIMDANPQEISSAMTSMKTTYLILIGASCSTVVFFLGCIALRQSAPQKAPA